jgi:uncharacterized protein HemY
MLWVLVIGLAIVVGILFLIEKIIDDVTRYMD